MGIGAVVYDVFFGFKTPHIVKVNNFQIGLVHRFVQLLIISYVIGVAIIYKKGYQETDTAQSVVTTKIKGVASTLNRFDLPTEYRRIFDPVDYVIPPQENSAFFVMTNAILTGPQKFGNCSENWRIAPCNTSKINERCHPGWQTSAGNGLMTGACLRSQQNHSSACEITGWCPVERNEPINSTEPLLPQVYNFTVMIKNSVEFPKFGVKKRNIQDTADHNYFKECRYEKHTDPSCPVFGLGYMIDEAKANFASMASQGGIININIEWDCDLDYDLDYCKPHYSFSEMDSGKGGSSPGWNFRYANYYRDANGTLTRDLVKAYGILFIFSLHGKAGKFSVIPLLLNIGAGLALLSLATIICDVFLLHCGKRRQTYKDHKFLNVIEGDSNKSNVAPRSPASIVTSASSKIRATNGQATTKKANSKPKVVAKIESESAKAKRPKTAAV